MNDRKKDIHVADGRENDMSSAASGGEQLVGNIFDHSGFVEVSTEISRRLDDQGIVDGKVRAKALIDGLRAEMTPSLRQRFLSRICSSTFWQFIIGWLVFAFSIFLLWKLNETFGYRKGEIDRGAWHVMRTTNGHGTYLEKGIDPGNHYLDADMALTMWEKSPNYVKNVQGFGATFVDIGWYGDAVLRSSGWHLFASEREALEFLKANDVKEDRISILYE